MNIDSQGDEPENDAPDNPSADPVRWGFCWLAGTLSDQICHHCEMYGMTLLVEVKGARRLRVLLLCEDHKNQYRRLWQAYAPEHEMSAQEAERWAC
jgi:hypothetical protein